MKMILYDGLDKTFTDDEMLVLLEELEASRSDKTVQEKQSVWMLVLDFILRFLGVRTKSLVTNQTDNEIHSRIKSMYIPLIGLAVRSFYREKCKRYKTIDELLDPSLIRVLVSEPISDIILDENVIQGNIWSILKEELGHHPDEVQYYIRPNAMPNTGKYPSIHIGIDYEPIALRGKEIDNSSKTIRGQYVPRKIQT